MSEFQYQLVYDIQISFRHGEWFATREGFEPEGLFGVGKTPVIALAHLLEQEDDAFPVAERLAKHLRGST